MHLRRGVQQPGVPGRLWWRDIAGNLISGTSLSLCRRLRALSYLFIALHSRQKYFRGEQSTGSGPQGHMTLVRCSEHSLINLAVLHVPCRRTCGQLADHPEATERKRTIRDSSASWAALESALLELAVSSSSSIDGTQWPKERSGARIGAIGLSCVTPCIPLHTAISTT